MDARGGSKERDSFMERMNVTYPVDVEATTFGGVKVCTVTPKRLAPKKQDRLLICLHGGGFTSDSGSLIESIPMAALTGTRVVSVLYRLAPQFPFPAAVEDSTAVYTTALKSHAPHKIAIYGTSAGAVLTAQTAVQIRKTSNPCRLCSASSRDMSISPAIATPGFFTAQAASRTSAP